MSAAFGLRMLVVCDGYGTAEDKNVGFSLAPTQDQTDCHFTISHFLYLLRTNSTYRIVVDTASRNPDPHAMLQNFVFTDEILAGYQTIWLFGYEGIDFGGAPTGGEKGSLSVGELQAIYHFMQRGGGVFATGDHDGLGSNMSGGIPRVRSMRKWYTRSEDLPADCQQGVTFDDRKVSMLNWTGGNIDTGNPSTSRYRLDTLRPNPGDKSATNFDFDNQSDNIPQTLKIVGPLHPILRGPNGAITRFPDHMHEGEVVLPSQTPSMVLGNEVFEEYPNEVFSTNGSRLLPQIVASGNAVVGHSTYTDDNEYTNSACQFFGDPSPVNETAATYGVIGVYDGWLIGLGRIVTQSTFHHFLDLNLLGNPLAFAADRRSGFGQPNQQPASGSVMADLQAYYANVGSWLSLPWQGLCSSNQFGVAGQTDVFAISERGNLAVAWCGVDNGAPGHWQGPREITTDGTFTPGGGIAVARRFALSDQTDLYAIDHSGQLQVYSAVGGQNWSHTGTIKSFKEFVPGGAIAVCSQGDVPTQTDVFSIDQSGNLLVSWTGTGNDWSGPQYILGPTLYPPGAPLAASPRIGGTGSTDVYCVSAGGHLVVTSTQQVPVFGQAAKTWLWSEDPVSIDGHQTQYPIGTPVCVSNQFGVAAQTDVFLVNAAGALVVYWAGPTGGWNGPYQISANGRFPPRAHVAASNQFGLPAQTDVFAIDVTGTLTVSWMVGSGKWHEPAAIGPAGQFFPGSAVSACQHFGLPDVTDVFATTKHGKISCFSVKGQGNWHATA